MPYHQRLASPLGELTVHATNQGITAVTFDDDSGEDESRSSLTDAACQQLHDYFEGRLQTFTLPLVATGTAFQQQVWQALAMLPYGQTVSYSAIARQLGNPNAVRAVGMANSKNPIAIIVPCHRVIGANGALTGYAGGLSRKAYLLKHEGVDI